MNNGRIKIVSLKILFVIFICSCALDPIVLHGDINGYVTDAETGEPLQEASVGLNQSDNTIDSTITGNTGSYLFKNLPQGNYEIQASKMGFDRITQNVEVTPANSTEVNFPLNKSPDIDFSDSYIDFGVDSNSKSFTISNAGTGILRYDISTSQDWITVYPNSGDITTEIDTITVTINRNEISDDKYEETINILTYENDSPVLNPIQVLVNGLLGQEGFYYAIVTIGNQVWMAENLNSGQVIYFGTGNNPADNDIIEKFCYADKESNCDDYGGLYYWNEMMSYSPPDSGLIGITQGICPAGWHIPTKKEFESLIEFLGGNNIAGEKLKDTSSHWMAPNLASNESGFRALPGGIIYYTNPTSQDKVDFIENGESCVLWTATEGDENTTNRYDLVLRYDDDRALIRQGPLEITGASVRCVKDP